MAIESVGLRCPNCGAPISVDMKVCEYCNSPVVVRTVNDIFSAANGVGNETNSVSSREMALAAGFLKAKSYDRAIAVFESVIQKDFGNADAYFYAAVAALKGKRPFLASPNAIKKAEEYLQTAIAIEPKGVYYYLWSYIRLDHHFKKFYKASPDYRELHSMAVNAGLSQADVKELFSTLDVEKPSEI